MTPATILALMIAFAQPGQSLYSQTVVAEDSGRACDNKMSLLCAEPKANPAWSGSFTRPETRDEALVRYRQIARLIDEVAIASTWSQIDGCKKPHVSRWGKGPSAECKAHHVARPWPGKADVLKRYMLTIVSHESAYRADVHAGRGNWSRGDCTDSKNPRTCRSSCLGQIMRTRRKWRSPRGYTWGSLAGLGDDATRRCLRTVADYLGHAKAVCSSPYGPAVYGPACAFRVYGGVTSPNHPRIAERVVTYRRFTKRSRALALPSK